MKTILIASLCSIFFCCTSNKYIHKNSGENEYIVTKIENEINSQTLFLKNDSGQKFKTINSSTNKNLIELKEGDRVSISVKEITKSNPSQIISKDIRLVNPIITHITTNKSFYKLNEPIVLAMTIKNTSKKSYMFLPWGTPLENSFTSDCLNVIYNDKESVNYTGIMVKRLPPTKNDSITIKPRKSTTGYVNVLDGYKLTEKGVYTIQFKENYRNLPSSNAINIEIK